jgi:hypothetical protein
VEIIYINMILNLQTDTCNVPKKDPMFAPGKYAKKQEK